MLYRKLALARGYARCNFCITFLQYYCSLYVLSTIYLENKNKKKLANFCVAFFWKLHGRTESYKKYYDDGMKTTNNKLLRQNQRVKNVNAFFFLLRLL